MGLKIFFKHDFLKKLFLYCAAKLPKNILIYIKTVKIVHYLQLTFDRRLIRKHYINKFSNKHN